MRTKVFPSVSSPRTLRLGGQLSLVALLAGLSAGCTSMPGITGPMFTGSTSNQKQIINGQSGGASNSYAQAGGYTQTASVQSNDLPPLAGATAAAYAPAPAYGGQAAYAPPAGPQPYQPPKPYAASGMPQPMGAMGAGGGQRPLGARAPGQTLAQLGSPPTSLGDQARRIDGGAPRHGSSQGGAYTVQSGDTMYNIAHRHGVSVDELVAANGGSTTARLGTRLTIPGGGPSSSEGRIQLANINPREVPEAVPAIVAPRVSAPALALPSQPPAPPVTQDIVTAPQPGPDVVSLAPQTQSGAETFRWPVHGRVISGFGKKADGERNDGINMAVPEGTAVKAAEDGTVIYAGSELKSYGNLVLIRHANGWVSAYAHNSELKVKRGDQVRRGQTVAVSGMSGGVTTPQVHFELRKDATPVDPLQHMAES